MMFKFCIYAHLFAKCHVTANGIDTDTQNTIRCNKKQSHGKNTKFSLKII